MSAQRDFSKLIVQKNESENSTGGIRAYRGMDLVRNLTSSDEPELLHTMFSLCEVSNRETPDVGWITMDGGLARVDLALQLPEAANDIQREYAGLDSWKRIAATIRHWRDLGEDWDGDDGVPPSKDALDAADKFVKTASEQGVAPPKPYISSDGEIGLTWRSGNRYATASFLPDGRFLAYCPVEQGEHVRLIVPYQQALSVSAEFIAEVRALTERHELVRSL